MRHEPGDLLILGGGGHAAVVAEAARAAGWNVVGVLDDGDVGVRTAAIGVEHLGPLDDLDRVTSGLAPAWRGHAATGDPEWRRAWLERLAPEKRATIVHPAAVVSPSATIANGVFIGPRAVVNARAIVASGAIINTGAIVEHDGRVGAFAHIAPGAVLGGGCVVGDAALIGAGSIVNPSTRVGSRATLGAGAVAVSDIPDGACAVGVPAR